MAWSNRCFCGALNHATYVKAGQRCTTCGGILTFNEWKTADGRPVQVFFEQMKRKKTKP